ncbi:MAG: hypothetical protein AAFZ15_27640 [Bacteroidota bacterium]
MENSQKKFIELLEEMYGARANEKSTLFGKTKASDIARELKYDPGQFSRLINPPSIKSRSVAYGENAYKIAIERLKLVKNFKEARNKNHQLEQEIEKKTKNNNTLLGLVVLLAIASVSLVLLFAVAKQKIQPLQTSLVPTDSLDNYLNQFYVPKDGIPLFAAFDRIFNFKVSEIDPYWYRENGDPEKCPCMRFQGKWGIDRKSAYQIPIPYEKGIDGYHYKSNKSRLYVWCKTNDLSGHTLEGLEIFENEIFLDTTRRSIDSFFSKREGLLNDKYYQIDFEKDPNFIKVAKINSLFYNEFKFKDHLLDRKAERWARYKYEIIGKNIAQLSESVKNEINQVVPEITKEYIGKMEATECEPLEVDEEINEGDILNFQCYFSFKAHHFKIPYLKRLIFEDQRLR